MNKAVACCTGGPGSIPLVSKSATFRLFFRYNVAGKNETRYDEKAFLSFSRM